MTMPDPVGYYDPPGFLPDFEGIRDQRDQWSAAVSCWFDGAIRRQKPDLAGQSCQFFDQTAKPAMAGPFLRQEIVWNGFPGTLRRRYGRRNAPAGRRPACVARSTNGLRQGVLRGRPVG